MNMNENFDLAHYFWSVKKLIQHNIVIILPMSMQVYQEALLR